MKSQDIGLLLKLICLQKRELAQFDHKARLAWPDDWRDWSDEASLEEPPGLLDSNLDLFLESFYTARGLEHETGISKTQVNQSLNRCFEVGLAKRDRKSGVPRANTKVLLEFIVYGLKYVYPVKPGGLTRGIGTSFSAPVLKDKLMSAGEFQLVWPDARGHTKGLAVEPLFKSVTYAVKKDPEMYAMLALVDAIRLGQPREANLAADLLKTHMEMPK